LQSSWKVIDTLITCGQGRKTSENKRKVFTLLAFPALLSGPMGQWSDKKNKNQMRSHPKSPAKEELLQQKQC